MIFNIKSEEELVEYCLTISERTKHDCSRCPLFQHDLCNEYDEYAEEYGAILSRIIAYNRKVKLRKLLT